MSRLKDMADLVTKVRLNRVPELVFFYPELGEKFVADQHGSPRSLLYDREKERVRAPTAGAGKKLTKSRS